MAECQAQRADGQPCSGTARLSGYCFAHDPALQARRQAARVQGGRNKATVSRLGKRMPASLRPVLDTLYGALTGLEEGTTDPKTATAMASVAGAIMRLYEGSELEGRLRVLEERGDEQHTR